MASTSRWIRRAVSDPFIPSTFAKHHANHPLLNYPYRARSAYKLLMTHLKYNLFKPNDVVVDIGAAPGSWSQVASLCTNHHLDTPRAVPNVIAIDRLDINDPIANVAMLTPMDVTCPKTIEMIQRTLSRRRVDVLLSDMAPNMSGIRDVDNSKSMELCEIVVGLTEKLPLRFGGTLFMKVFQGGQEVELKKRLESLFKRVQYVKPEASRKESREIYLLCRDYHRKQ